MQLGNKHIIPIRSGQYYVTNDSNTVIFTIVGSCIAVCLFDEVSNIGGMNHFMLPEEIAGSDCGPGDYGLQSMEIMIGKILFMGAKYHRLKAKVFGGGKVLRFFEGKSNVAEANVKFIFSYLGQKGIPIVAQDVGGFTGRKLYYRLRDHSVFLQHLRDKEMHEVER